MVATRPILLVTAESAPSNVSGSSRDAAVVRLQVSTSSAPKVALVSAVNSRSNLPRSAVRAISAKCCERLPRVHVDVGIAPGGDVMAAALEEQPELHHGHGLTSERRRSAWILARIWTGHRDRIADSVSPLRATSQTPGRSAPDSRWRAGWSRSPCRRPPSARRTSPRSCRPCARPRRGWRCSSRSRW